MLTQKNILASLIGAAILTACGGGGGHSVAPSTQSTPNQQHATQNTQTESAKNTSEQAKSHDAGSNQSENHSEAAQSPQSKPTNTANKLPEKAATTTPPAQSQPADAANALPEKNDEPVVDLKQINQNTLSQQLDAFLHTPKYGNLAQLRLNTDDDSIIIDLLPDATGQTHKEFINDPKIHTLKDSAGKLIAYYGYAGIKQNKKNDYDGAYEWLSDDYLYVFSADESRAKRPDIAANQAMKYSGKMLFHYDTDVANVRTATVDATYFGGDKKFSMDIYSDEMGENRSWTLREEKFARSNAKVDVNDSGKISGHLFSKDSDKHAYSGTFSGGLYGENGDVLTGKVSHTEGDKIKFEGVIGATGAVK